MSRSQRLLELVQVLRRHRQPVSRQALADELGAQVTRLDVDDPEVGLAENLEPLVAERGAGLFEIVDVHGDRRAAVGVNDQRIRVMDVHLGLQQGRAEVR